jgi:hypothetical protein
MLAWRTLVNLAAGKPVASGTVCGGATANPPPTGQIRVTATATPGNGSAILNWDVTGVTDPTIAGVWIWRIGTRPVRASGTAS